MKRTMPPLILAAALSGLFAVNAAAYGPSQGCDRKSAQHKMSHKSRSHHPIAMMLKDMDLTSEQLDALKSIGQEQRQARKASGRKNPGQRAQAMADAITAEGFNGDALAKAERERADRRIAMRTERLQKIIAVLTPEQRLELKAKFEAQASGKNAILAGLGE
jgi:Spy/CpxP family protein refolding chaperone